MTGNTRCWRPMPYPEADRPVRFRIESRTPRGTTAFDALPASTALQWGAGSSTLSAMAVYTERALTLSTANGRVSHRAERQPELLRRDAGRPGDRQRLRGGVPARRATRISALDALRSE